MQISADTGIAKITFYSWLKKHNFEKETAKKKTVNFRNFMLLESKVERLENMVDTLKNVGGIEDIPLSLRIGVHVSG